MFGVHHIPFRIGDGSTAIQVDPGGAFSTYTRISPGEKVKKQLGYREGKVIINPVEPVNLPKEVTGMLEFHFPPVTMSPGSTITLYLKFPVEIGVFVGDNENYTLIDVFSRAKAKYSLYGTPEKGFITRHVESEVYDSAPPSDPLEEGVMTLSLKNSSRDWIEVSRAVFEVSTMRLFYGNTVVMTGEMEIISRLIAITRISAIPPGQGMNTALRVYPTKKSLIPEKLFFMMEYGVGD